MSRRRRALAAFAVIATVALISACGSSTPAQTSTDSASSNGSGGSRSSNIASKGEKGVKFADCMRSNGVSNFPDPNASGKFTIEDVANGSSVDTSAPAFTRAISACKDLEPTGFTGGTRSAAQQSGALKFAECIRKNGVTDFPDPVNGQPLVDTNRIPSSNLPGGMSILNAAMHKCRGLGAAAGAHR